MRVPRLDSRITDARTDAARHEAGLEPQRRKRLGQFFTGLPLGRLLAALSLDTSASSVIDPMAGNGDLIDAAIERAFQRRQLLSRVEGVEVDDETAGVCSTRIAAWLDEGLVDSLIVRSGDAFDETFARDYDHSGYDLVITNPPYVRYQSLSAESNETSAPRSATDIRRSLIRIAQSRIDRAEWPVWRVLIERYSGLADLSVPAWILAASLVRAGGVLALVAPATWRSRNYGDIIQYLLARCFRIEFLVEDTQPGWFSDALVRTQLVVARRRPSQESCAALRDRPRAKDATVTARVSPPASANGSLVGKAFPSGDPEHDFAQWLRRVDGSGEDQSRGLSWTVALAQDMWDGAFLSAMSRGWYSALEQPPGAGLLFAGSTEAKPTIVPPVLRPLLDDLTEVHLVLPGVLGISISQGLRTGCNGFFYVDLVAELAPDRSVVRVSQDFGGHEIEVPSSCLVPVVRGQAEVQYRRNDSTLKGRVLDLSRWVLPEDAADVERARHLYAREGTAVPTVMPPALAEFVRRAAEKPYGAGPRMSKIPELSAVRTNVRDGSAGRTPRFWYMLPPFANRHRPAAFVARVNQDVPTVEVNDDPPVLIDANFSTVWAEKAGLSRYTIRALLNSSWCRACMEALGTPLGGGALKLEATQLRRMPLPALTAAELVGLDTAGRGEGDTDAATRDAIDRVVTARIIKVDAGSPRASALTDDLRARASEWARARRRKPR